MRLQVTTTTHVGHVRTENQDAAVNGGSILLDGPGMMRMALEGPTLVAVIDGMGGHAGGRQAAATTARRLSELQMLPTKGVEQVIAALQAADDDLHHLQDTNDRVKGLGCVVTALVLDNDLSLVNVGDAPAIHLDHGYLTKLHTPDVSTNGALTASIGGTTHRQVLRPHVLPLDVKDDGPLVLCSDGLTDAITDDELERLMTVPDAGLAGRLLEAALAAGAPDNVTISVVDLEAT